MIEPPAEHVRLLVLDDFTLAAVGNVGRVVDRRRARHVPRIDETERIGAVVEPGRPRRKPGVLAVDLLQLGERQPLVVHVG